MASEGILDRFGDYRRIDLIRPSLEAYAGDSPD